MSLLFRYYSNDTPEEERAGLEDETLPMRCYPISHVADIVGISSVVIWDWAKRGYIRQIRKSKIIYVCLEDVCRRVLNHELTREGEGDS